MKKDILEFKLTLGIALVSASWEWNAVSAPADNSRAWWQAQVDAGDVLPLSRMTESTNQDTAAETSETQTGLSIPGKPPLRQTSYNFNQSLENSAILDALDSNPTGFKLIKFDSSGFLGTKTVDGKMKGFDIDLLLADALKLQADDSSVGYKTLTISEANIKQLDRAGIFIKTTDDYSTRDVEGMVKA